MSRPNVQQFSIFDVNADAIGLGPAAFERHLAALVRRLFTDEDFAGMYHDQLGRTPCSPYVLVGIQMLRFFCGLGEEAVIERCRRDLGFKFALGLRADEDPPSARSLSRFWSKLCEKFGDDVLHRRVLQLAVEEEVLDDQALQAIDSTNTDCRGAVIDTYNLIAVAIGQVVRRMAQSSRVTPADLLEQWKLPARYLDRSPKGAAGIDWNDRTARDALLTAQIQDADRVVETVDGLGDAVAADVIEAVALLRTVTHQDVEQLADGTYRIAQGTVPGRIISITDPEARHGRKSASKVINGFKVHVMCTISTLFCTGIVMTDASAHDATPTGELLDQAAGNAVEPETMLGDGAYTTGGNMKQCEQRGVELRGKMSAPSSKDALPKQSFDIDLDTMIVTCPAGNTTDRWTSVTDPGDSGAKVPRFHFDKQTCQGCPLKDRCSSATRNGRERTITLNPHEDQLQKLKEFNQREDAPRLLRKRSAVERLISHLVRMGMRHARFFTMKRVQFQAYMTAAVYNLQRYLTLESAAGG